MAPIVLLAAYATGIAMVHWIAPWSTTGLITATGLLLLASLCLYKTRWAWLPILGAVLVSGFLNASFDLEPPSRIRHISTVFEATPLLLEGRVITLEERSAGGYRLYIEMCRIWQKQSAATAAGKVLVFIKEGALNVRPGQVVRWRAPLRRPSRFGNPGEFDYPSYLAARGIYLTSFINRAEDLVALANHPDEKSEHLENLRLSLATRIKQVAPEDSAGLVQSLLLGIRSSVSNEQRQILADGGVAHLFAISGLHFGLLALLLYQMGRLIYTRSQRLILWCPPQRILPVLLIIPLGLYLCLTGNAWSTQRAFLMVAIVALLFARGRRTSPFSLLATVALCLLIYTPLSLFQPGFQLSFSGVAGILAWLPCWQRPISGCPKLVRWPLALFLTTSAATLATAPSVLWNFHQFAPAGLITNMVAIPLIAWCAIPAGLTSLAILPIAPWLSDWALLITAKLVAYAIDMATSISQWPGLTVIPIYLTTSRLILLVGALLLLLPMGSKKDRWFARLAVLLMTLTAAFLTRPQIADFQITAISVGQGDATLVSMREGAHYLVDGGGLPGSSIDPGERLVAPALGRMGVSRLKGVILTHNHPDHSSGLTYILKRFPAEAFYMAGEAGDLAPELQKVLDQQDIPVKQVEEGWSHIETSEDQRLSLFVPSQRDQDKNERSIAVFAGQQQDGVLLTADLGKSGLSQLKSSGLPGPVSLLKLPHHGSRHAHPEAYLDWLQPTAAFVSSGRGNPYGFPHEQSVTACNKKQIPLFRTDHDGMLIFRLENGRWRSGSRMQNNSCPPTQTPSKPLRGNKKPEVQKG